ncbi:hypothetical protein H0H92_013298 [Tricholoma furcatifolium]|nr:hypothetical protein H0H92_013298 [Tricholoma furcatifolium]
METFSFVQFTGSRAVVHAALYTNVSNGGEVRKRIIDAATAEGEEGEAARDAVNFAYIDARLITSRLHLQTAIYQAMLAESQDALRTRTVHSEVIWALNPTNNITEALRRYGISDQTNAVIVVSMDGAPEEKMGAGIAGTPSPFSELEKVTDWASVRKAGTLAFCATMLPKVATQLLHTTTRAVTSIQHQSYTLRNVLQNPSAGSSHWGNGPGPGGAKYNAGSRYNPFFGAGRAVTQANATISSNDGSFSQTDDQEEVPTRHSTTSATRRTRMRSNSLSLPPHGRTERAEKLGVLKTVQLHARSRHAFASPLGVSTPVEDTVPSSPRPILARRNSTSAPPPTEAFDPSIPAPTPRSSRPSTPNPVAPESPQSVNPPKIPNKEKEKDYSSHAARRLVTARDSGDPALAAQAVREFRQTTVKPNVREFNYALEALQATRRAGEPLNLMLETYNDMLRHSLLPNLSTYIILIETLAARDQEIHSAITSLEVRLKHRTVTGVNDIASDDADRKRIEVLKIENNFPMAMSLFEHAISIGGNTRFAPNIYACLLRSCAIHGNIDAAIHVFAKQEERGNMLPTVWTFLEMIRVYTNAGQLAGAEQIFAEYRAAVKRGDIRVYWARADSNAERGAIFVWNQMIETYFRFDRADKAIALVEQMLAAEPSQQGLIIDPPPVATSTFTTVLTGFCQLGDVQTALLWFDRLLAQNEGSSDPYEPAGAAVKPDSVAWGVMLDSLAVKGMVDDLNRLFVIRLQDHHRQIRHPERLVVFAANIAHASSMTEEQFLWSMDFLQNHVLAATSIRMVLRRVLVDDIAAAYLGRKMYEKALDVLSKYYSLWITATTTNDHDLGAAPPVDDLRTLQLNFTKKLYEVSQGDVPYLVPRTLARLAGTIRISQPPEYTPFFLHSYAVTRASGSLPEDMTLRDWELLVMAASEYERVSNENPIDIPNYAFHGLASLMRDLAAYKVPFEKMNQHVIRHVIFLLSEQLGMDGLVALFKETGFVNVLDASDRPQAALQQAIDDSASETNVTEGTDSGYASSPTQTTRGLRIDSALSSTILNDLKPHPVNKPESSAISAFAKFRFGFETGRIPTATALSSLIQAFGRMGRIEEMQYTYSAAQRLLEILESDKEQQATSWMMVENAMVIGLAHHGDVEGAHIHRQRLLQHGSAPDANAYGALIYNVKDTTDDASIALELFNESRTHQVSPNQYLYNNIISKLAKARKADYAMELFQQMKALGIPPSSVTYGALIGACARVGDVHSAELLFTEMTEAKNFRPRIPPYNTMMQMYTTTKPDRARALYFYDEMRKANIKPTAHTYKLLLDAHGAIEPVDIAGMEATFLSLKADKSTSVQGIHFASLINAHGCVSKNLEAAVKVFQEMTIAPDALVFEAMINTLVVHRRGDLIAEYVNKMHIAGVHMTAYIANSLIKCYSLLNNVEEARRVFEALEDPPVGVAAPNNHAPHAPVESPVVDQNAPVYREPSTWEAMIRAELGSGNREGALALLERLRARQTIPRSSV